MIRTSNNKASYYVENQIPFKGSNTFGEWNHNLYIVYSYGKHFPMYLFDGLHWYGNSDKFSSSTSKQQTQLHPNKTIIWLTTDELKRIINERG
jgi:uncharacterized protein (UPF0333 family)